jgi:hypothetical protein
MEACSRGAGLDSDPSLGTLSQPSQVLSVHLETGTVSQTLLDHRCENQRHRRGTQKILHLRRAIWH